MSRSVRRVVSRLGRILRLIVLCLGALGPGAPPPPPAPRRQVEVLLVSEQDEDDDR